MDYSLSAMATFLWIGSNCEEGKIALCLPWVAELARVPISANSGEFGYLSNDIGIPTGSGSGVPAISMPLKTWPILACPHFPQ
jgi:hypothetical protein